MHLEHLIRKHRKCFIHDRVNESTPEAWQEFSNQYQQTETQLQVLPITVFGSHFQRNLAAVSTEGGPSTCVFRLVSSFKNGGSLASSVLGRHFSLSAAGLHTKCVSYSFT